MPLQLSSESRGLTRRAVSWRACLATALSTAECLAQALHDEFEVDFVSLSFARTADDVVQAREFLDSAGLTTTKARPLCG